MAFQIVTLDDKNAVVTLVTLASFPLKILTTILVPNSHFLIVFVITSATYYPVITALPTAFLNNTSLPYFALATQVEIRLLFLMILLIYVTEVEALPFLSPYVQFFTLGGVEIGDGNMALCLKFLLEALYIVGLLRHVESVGREFELHQNVFMESV
jgi:hypothetical protein